LWLCLDATSKQHIETLSEVESEWMMLSFWYVLLMEFID
jgi:hypothetical protein